MPFDTGRFTAVSLAHRSVQADGQICRPRLRHPLPDVRLSVMTQGGIVSLAGIGAGGASAVPTATNCSAKPAPGLRLKSNRAERVLVLLRARGGAAAAAGDGRCRRGVADIPSAAAQFGSDCSTRPAPKHWKRVPVLHRLAQSAWRRWSAHCQPREPVECARQR